MNKDNFKKELGALCRSCRERLGYTQYEMGRRVDMSCANISKFENGERDSLIMFSVYGLMFDGEDWRKLNDIYNRYFKE